MDRDTLDRDGVFAVIVRSVREVVPELDTHSFQAGDQLKELGLDSVERSEVIVLTLQALGLAIPLREVHGPRNLGELADLLVARLPR